MKILRYFYKAYRLRTVLTCVAITLSGIIEGISISALIPLIAQLISERSPDDVSGTHLDEFFTFLGIHPSIPVLLTFVVSGILIKSILLAGAKVYAGFTVAKVVKDLRIDLLRRLSTAEWQFFANRSGGKLAASLMGEASMAGNAYLTSLNILSTLVQVTAYLIVAFFISWLVVVLAIVSSIILVLLLRRFIEINRRLGQRRVSLTRQITGKLTDSTRSIKSLKAMARETQVNAILDSYTKKLKSVSRKATIASELLGAFQEIFLTVAIVIGLFLSVYFLQLPVQSIIVLAILYIRSMKLVGKSQKLYQQFVNDENGFNGIMESIEAARLNYELRQGTKQQPLTGDISIRDVSFSYGTTSVFDHASAVIRHCKLNTIIGPSGAGKTTLIDLIAGLIRPASGEIFVDDVPLAEIDIQHWRKQIGYVIQENTLLNTTVRENITLGDMSYDNETIAQVLIKAHADSFVGSLPDGIDTLVGENGAKLSGGQRQRILIARALVHQPRLLILDEATSALDYETERSLSQIFKELSKQITIISISHRPALIELSDHIFKLNHGQLQDVTVDYAKEGVTSSDTRRSSTI